MTAVSRDWRVERRSGSAETLFAVSVPPFTRLVRVATPTRPTIVLGSGQRTTVIDRELADRHGVDVVTRRSGGAAVWLDLSATAWVDVLIPADDPLHVDDVTESFFWLGACWRAALLASGASPRELAVHQQGLRRSRWSELVCFAGLGPGEVTAKGRKIVGLSQRRTRDYALFQCALVRHWDPSPLVALLHDDALAGTSRSELRAELANMAIGTDAINADDTDRPIDGLAVVDRLIERLG